MEHCSGKPQRSSPCETSRVVIGGQYSVKCKNHSQEIEKSPDADFLFEYNAEFTFCYSKKVFSLEVIPIQKSALICWRIMYICSELSLFVCANSSKLALNSQYNSYYKNSFSAQY